MTARGWRAVVVFPLVLLALASLAFVREPLGIGLFYVTLLSTLFFWTAQATSWNILSGYSGYFSFGQGAFAGAGIYTTAVLIDDHGWNFFATLPVAALLATVLALGIGALAFRLRSFRGATFALLTLAVPFILAAVARLSPAIDGGQGQQVPVPDVPEPLRFQEFFYLVMLGVAGGAVAIGYAIWHTRFGWALAAIRDQEDVAEGLGVATFQWKMLAIGATGMVGGAAGGAWALQSGYLQVGVVFSLTLPLFVIVMSVLGGRTHWLGPLAGAAVIVLLQDQLTSGVIAELSGGALESWRLVVFGALLAAMVILAPQGLTARLRARPWLSLAAGLGTLLALLPVGALGLLGMLDLLDQVAAAMVVTALVAFWPARWLPARLVRSLPAAQRGPSAPAGPAAAATEPAAAPTGHDALALSVAPALRDPPARQGEPGEVVVECAGLVRHFGGVRALDGVDLQIREGELVGLVGPNGSGKTTLVNLLTGSLRPTHGSIHVVGRDTARLAPHTFTHVGITRTYQVPRPFESMTVRDNVAVALMFGRQPRPLAAARAEAAGHLEFVGLGPLADAYPSDVNLHQRQLLEMARALATSPTVLLLDEALAGLNPAEIDSAVQVVRRIHDAGVTIVIVEHLLRVVNQLATRIVVLDRGRLLADGDPEAVLGDPAVVEAYLGKSHA